MLGQNVMFPLSIIYVYDISYKYKVNRGIIEVPDPLAHTSEY